MARGLRSSRNKTNNSKLRSEVFGPVESKRKERLSAKLTESALNPKPDLEEDATMMDHDKVNSARNRDSYTPQNRIDLSAINAEPKDSKERETESETRAIEQGMEVDRDRKSTEAAKSTKSGSKSCGRIQKRKRGKARAAMVFPVYKKGVRVGPYLKNRQRRKTLRP